MPKPSPSAGTIALLLAAALLFLAGCQQESKVPTVDEQPLEMTLRVSDSVLVLGGRPDTITVTLRNPFTRNIRLAFPTTCQIRVYIRDARGRTVLPEKGEYTCSPINTQIDIVARGSTVERYIWTGGPNFVPPEPSRMLSPGVYFVSARLTTFGVSLTAFPIRVRIAAP